MRAHTSFLVVLASMCLLASCSRPRPSGGPGADKGEPRPAAPPPDPPSCELVTDGYGPAGEAPVHAEVVADGLVVPWAVAFLPTGDILLTEREGRLRLVQGGALVDEPVATVPVTKSTEEGGLLGLALHPKFSENSQFFLYYTRDDEGRAVNRIARWVLERDGKAFRAREEAVVFDDIPSFKFHNGGRIRFGPDGKLYAGTGDAGQPDLSQRKESPAGKLLRLEASGSIPPDNPFRGAPEYLLGIRNLQAFDWFGDGRVVLADHGPSGEMNRRGHDELDVASAGDNLGWPTAWKCEHKDDLVTPLVVFQRPTPPGGGSYYDRDAIPEWKGSFLVGTLASKHLHRFAFDADRRRVTHHEVYFEGEPPHGFGRLRDVVVGPDGAVYVTTSNCDGRGTCPKRKDALLRVTSGAKKGR